MKKQQLTVLIVILIVLLALGIFKKGQKAAKFENQTAATLLQIQFDKNQVEKIQFKKSDSAFYDLVKKGGEWQVPSSWNSKADAAKIGNLLEQLSGLRAELRADSADVLSDFELTDADAFRLILYDASGAEMTQLLLSYKNPQGGGSFVRAKDSNAIYLTEENLFPILGIYGDAKSQELKAVFWLSLKYFSVDPTKVELMTLKKMDGDKENVVFDLKRESSQILDGKSVDRWSIEGLALPFPVASEKVYRFLGQISQGLAREVVDPAGQYGLEKPDWIMTVKETDKELKTVKLKSPSDKNQDFVYLTTTETTSIFKVASSVVQSLNVEPTYFEPTTPFFDSMKDWQVVRVKANEKAINFIKTAGEDSKSVWKIDGQDTQPEQQKIDDYLKVIENFSVVQFLKPNQELPKDISNVSFEIETGDKQITKIEISPTPDSAGSYTAVKSGFRPAFLISRETYDQVILLPQ